MEFNRKMSTTGWKRLWIPRVLMDSARRLLIESVVSLERFKAHVRRRVGFLSPASQQG